MTSVARMSLLATSISGQLLEVVPGAPGEPSWTNGVEVFIDEALATRQQIRAVAVQACLVGTGSLAPDVLGGLGRRSAVLQRYLAVEGHRALAAARDLLPPSLHSLIDPVTAARSACPAESLALATGHERLPAPPPEFGAIRPKRVRTQPAAGRAAPAAVHLPRQQRQELLQELDDAEDAEREGSLDWLNPIGGGGAVGRLLQKLLGSSRSRGTGQPGADQPTHTSRRGGQFSAGATVSSTRAALSAESDGPRHAGFTYPEWNVHERRYRHAWCTVTELAPESAAIEAPGSDPRWPAGAQALRRPLARLGMELERQHRQPQGDDLDIDAVVAARADIAAGGPGDEAVYIDSIRRRRDLSVLVLLDVSGSAGEPSAIGTTVHEQQRLAAAALTSALTDLGDRVALYAFRSRGRSAVQVLPLKRFADRFDAAAVRRLGGVEPGAYTRLGAAIRHGAAVLETDGGTARRLLLVLSDGFAYDHGYEGDYGEADARRALAEARRRGTACLCLSIGAALDADALRRVFGTAAYASIPRTQELPALVGPLFRSALRLAEVQRRVFQRQERTRERLRVERTSV